MSQEITLNLALSVNNPSTGGGFADTVRVNQQYTQNQMGANEALSLIGIAPQSITYANLTTPGWAFLQNLDSVNPLLYGVQGPSLAAPVQNALSTAAGGTLVAGTYYYVVTATTPGGETLVSNEENIVTAANGKNTVSWTAVPNATGYNVYRGTGTGAENTVFAASGTSFVDTGAGGTAQTPPAVNTTSFWAFGKAEAGEMALLRLAPGVVLQMAARGAPVYVNYRVYED